jgi:hypothetical protein
MEGRGGESRVSFLVNFPSLSFLPLTVECGMLTNIENAAGLPPAFPNFPIMARTLCWSRF